MQGQKYSNIQIRLNTDSFLAFDTYARQLNKSVQLIFLTIYLLIQFAQRTILDCQRIFFYLHIHVFEMQK
jgi:hypothetical protein